MIKVLENRVNEDNNYSGKKDGWEIAITDFKEIKEQNMKLGEPLFLSRTNDLEKNDLKKMIWKL